MATERTCVSKSQPSVLTPISRRIPKRAALEDRPVANAVATSERLSQEIDEADAAWTTTADVSGDSRAILRRPQ